MLAWLPLAVGLLLGAVAFAPPAPVGADAPADRFSAERALAVLERLVGEGSPHPVGTPANDAVRERLLAELAALGLEPETQAALGCNLRFEVCADVVNVIARLPGGGDGPVVLLAAHYDSVGAGPGAGDDLAGVAALLEAARALLAGAPTPNPVALLFTDGEEAGLLGARAFLGHPLAPEVGVVANLEARGSRGPSFLFETSADNAWLIRAFASQARRAVTSSLLYEVYRLLPNDTDLTEFRGFGMAGVNFAFVGGLPHYHTPLDSVANLSLASLQHHGENALAAARAFGDADLAAPPAGAAVFTYVAPGLVLQAPLGATLPLALLGLALVAAALVGARRARRVTLAGWGLGVAAVVGALVLAGLLGSGVPALLSVVRPEAEPWYARPLPTRVAVWAAAVLAVSLAVAPAARNAGRWGLALGAWTVWAVVTAGVAAVLPGAAAELLVTLLVAALLLVVAAWLGRARRGWSLGATALAAAVAAYTWLPLAVDIEGGLGLALAGAVAVVVALVAGTAAPLLAPPEERLPRPEDVPAAPGARPAVDRRAGTPRDRPRRAAMLAAGLAGVVTVAALGVALLTPAYTELWPRRLSLAHLQEWEDGALTNSRWLADPRPDGPLPPALAAVADWREPAALLPFTGSRYPHAPAPAASGTPPTLEVVYDEQRGEERVVGVALRTSAAPLATLLALPADVGLAEVRFVGSVQAWDFRRVAGLRDRLVQCRGHGCEGRVVELTFRNEGPYRVRVVEVVAGLPESGAALAAARPATAVPSQDGDVTVQVHAVTLP